MKKCADSRIIRISINIPVRFCSLGFGVTLILLAIVAISACSYNFAIAFFTALGAIATATMCFLTWKMLQVSQKQFNALNADHILAKLAWDNELVIFVLENSGTLPADEITVKFPQWFNEKLDELNRNHDYVKSMTDILRTNKRPLQGHSTIAFLLCTNKESFYKQMKPHKAVRVSLSWRNLNGKMRNNTFDIDLVDEVILDAEPIAKIASFSVNSPRPTLSFAIKARS